MKTNHANHIDSNPIKINENILNTSKMIWIDLDVSKPNWIRQEKNWVWTI